MPVESKPFVSDLAVGQILRAQAEKTHKIVQVKRVSRGIEISQAPDENT